MKLLLILFFLAGPSICQAQLPVSQEPRHHKVLDNGHVRLLDVHIPPGDTTQFHVHSTPSVFIILTDAKSGSQVISEEDQSASPVKHFGNIWFEGFYIKPRIHRVYNNDKHEYNVMDIELTNKKDIAIDPPITEETFRFLFDEKPVRAYRITMEASANIFVPARKADILIIQLSDPDDSVRVNEKSFHKKGDFYYITAGSSITSKNYGGGTAEFAFFELK